VQLHINGILATMEDKLQTIPGTGANAA